MAAAAASLLLAAAALRLATPLSLIVERRTTEERGDGGWGRGTEDDNETVGINQCAICERIGQKNNHTRR